MYKILVWKDNARDPQHTYKPTTNPDGTITLLPVGTVIQQGTNQSANNFNNMETGIFGATEMSVEAIRNLRLLQRSTEGLVGEKIAVTLTNALAYPFNNSKKTISLGMIKNHQNYTIAVELISSMGGGVGDIIITEKLLNGFKIQYTGAATSVVVNCYVQGGL